MKNQWIEVFRAGNHTDMGGVFPTPVGMKPCGWPRLRWWNCFSGISGQFPNISGMFLGRRA